MNSFRFIYFFVCCSSGASFGSEQGPLLPPDPPQPPLVSNAPSVAAWRIAFDDKSKLSSEGSKPFRAVHTTKELQVTKMDKIRRTVMVWNDGMVTEAWYVGIYVLEDTGIDSDIFIIRNDRILTSQGTTVANFSASDFPDLAWISLANYTGIDVYRGRKCYHFRIKSHPADDRPPKPGKSPQGTLPNPLQGGGLRRVDFDQEAWIDVKSKLPVGFLQGNTMKAYSFQSDGFDQPVLPPRFATALRKYQALENSH